MNNEWKSMWKEVSGLGLFEGTNHTYTWRDQGKSFDSFQAYIFYMAKGSG
jgi:hypothetical protein